MGYFFLGGIIIYFYIYIYFRVFRLVYLACRTVEHSAGLRSDLQGSWKEFCVSLPHGVHSTSQESQSSNFFLLQESKALAIPLTSLGFGLVFPPFDIL